MKDLSRWTIFAAAAVVLVGCGGGGNNNFGSTSGGNAGSSGGDASRQVPSVVLSNAAELQTVFLSGQGRRAAGSQLAVIRKVQYQNGDQDFVPGVDQYTFPDLRIQLDGYTLNARSFTVDVPAGVEGRTFSEFPLEIYAIEEIQSDGSTIPLTSQTPALDAGVFAADVTAIPGRQTSVQITLDDSILRYDSNQGVVFDQNLFITKNYDIRTNSIHGFLSDFVSFDISGLAKSARPNLSNGKVADKVLITGDSVAISAGADAPDTLEVLNPVRVENGILRNPKMIGGKEAPGIYTLEEIDPRDLSQQARLTSLQGIWRPYTSVLTNVGTFVMMAFPNTRSPLEQQLIAFSRNGSGAITAMYQGVVRYNAGVTSATFSLWPISQLDNADTANELKGTMSNITTDTGATGGKSARQGTFKFTTSPPAVTNFPSSGVFIVFKR